MFIFCAVDIFLPFLSFMALFDYNWLLITTQTGLDDKGWLIAPVAILLLVAIVFMYITSVQFPTDQRAGWRLLRGVLISLAVMLASSGSQWQAGLFQYGLLQLLALALAFGVVLPQQKSIFGWLFGLPAVGWAAVAAWVSYQLYVGSFFFSASWLDWVLWPVWLFAAVPLFKTRYHLITDFFADYRKRQVLK
ncbi:MAG: hypothetical protein HY565_01045 [Candidatus Kerfeldbacteria bacterium]|nr:hypothetical protein [Candidatus Kerfeldbacteria bacterium]